MKNFKLTAGQVKEYNKNGYLVVPSLLNNEEVDKLYNIAIQDDAIRRHSFDLNDQSGRKTKLALWYTPGNDAYGLLSRSRRLVKSVDALMAGTSAVCHFHSKLIQKEPRTGGAWEWHQDYGYWYKNEFLFPDQMISAMIAITESNKQNGCLQVIEGSHKMGRVEHGLAGEQVGAAQRYVDLALKSLPLIYVELLPGDALFFHSNLLHRSAANLSDNSRWSLISCYNRQANEPHNEPSGSSIIPIEMVPDEALLRWESSTLAEDSHFLDKEKDEALK